MNVVLQVLLGTAVVGHMSLISPISRNAVDRFLPQYRGGAVWQHDELRPSSPREKSGGKWRLNAKSLTGRMLRAD